MKPEVQRAQFRPVYALVGMLTFYGVLLGAALAFRWYEPCLSGCHPKEG